jgi:hypothetical protein
VFASILLGRLDCSLISGLCRRHTIANHTRYKPSIHPSLSLRIQVTSPILIHPPLKATWLLHERDLVVADPLLRRKKRDKERKTNKKKGEAKGPRGSHGSAHDAPPGHRLARPALGGQHQLYVGAAILQLIRHVRPLSPRATLRGHYVCAGHPRCRRSRQPRAEEHWRCPAVELAPDRGFIDRRELRCSERRHCLWQLVFRRLLLSIRLVW